MVMGYGVEIWGWREREKIEHLQEKYIRWIMGVDWNTPGYLVREEWQRGNLRESADRRAWSFEKRLEEGKGSSIARRCWEEMRDRMKGGGDMSDWEKERSDFFRGKGGECKGGEKRGRE